MLCAFSFSPRLHSSLSLVFSFFFDYNIQLMIFADCRLTPFQNSGAHLTTDFFFVLLCYCAGNFVIRKRRRCIRFDTAYGRWYALDMCWHMYEGLFKKKFYLFFCEIYRESRKISASISVCMNWFRKKMGYIYIQLFKLIATTFFFNI